MTPRDATVTADPQTRTFGADNPTLTATVQGTVNGDVLDFTLATTVDPLSAVGSASISVTLGTNSNYHVTANDGTLTIDKAHLTVNADDQGKTYDGLAFGSFTATIIGFVNDDSPAVVSGSTDFSGSATTAVDAGSYPITPSLGSLTAANYDFTTFDAGTLTINKVDATITVAGYSGTYDSAAHGASLVSATGVDAGGTALGTSFTSTTLTDIPGGTASWTFHGGVNYNDQSGTAAVAIAAPAFLMGNVGTFTDSDGDKYTVKLTGAGQLAVGQDAINTSGKGPIQWILVQATDPAKSVLTVTVVKAKAGDGLVSIGSIEGTGLKSIAAAHSDLLGAGIRLSGFLGGLTGHDLGTGAQLVAGGTAAQSTTISAHVIEAGTVIQLGSSIASLTAAAVQGGTITAPSIGTLTIAGDAQFKVNGVRSPIAGDFDAALTLTGTGNPKKPAALGSATIAGGIQNAAWNISGDSGTVTARGSITDWTANVHGKLAGLTLGSVAQASVTVDQALATLSAKSWTAGGADRRLARYAVDHGQLRRRADAGRHRRSEETHRTGQCDHRRRCPECRLEHQRRCRPGDRAWNHHQLDRQRPRQTGRPDAGQRGTGVGHDRPGAGDAERQGLDCRRADRRLARQAVDHRRPRGQRHAHRCRPGRADTGAGLGDGFRDG